MHIFFLLKMILLDSYISIKRKLSYQILNQIQYDSFNYYLLYVPVAVILVPLVFDIYT